MKVLGLIVFLSLCVGAGALYWNANTFESQAVPDSYKVLDDLEDNGIYKRDDLSFKTLEGKTLNLHDFKGKVVILSFWATWCEPCVEEFPSFIKLLDEFPEKVVLIAISHDYEEEDVEGFVEAFNGNRENLILTMDKEKEMSKVFEVDRLPEGFVFNKEGLLVKKIIGIQDWATPNAIEFFKSL